MVFKNNSKDQNSPPNVQIQLLKRKKLCSKPRDFVTPVACPRLKEPSNPLITCAILEENLEMTKDYCGHWDLSYP